MECDGAQCSILLLNDFTCCTFSTAPFVRYFVGGSGGGGLGTGIIYPKLEVG